MEKFKKILVFRLSGIGDIMFTLPAINLIKDNFPDSEVTFVTYKEFTPLIRGFFAVDKILPIDRQLYKRKNLKEIFNESKSILHSLRKEKYDLVIDFHHFGETVLMSWLTGSKNRWGDAISKFQACFYTWNLSKKKLTSKHSADKNFELLVRAGLKPFPVKNNFMLPDEELMKAKQLLTEFHYSFDKPMIYIQPFTHRIYKNWPLSNYIQFAEYWENHGVQIIFGGGPADRESLTAVAGKFPVTAGKASLLTNAGLMKLSNLVIGGDTGLLHVATALGSRVLMLMGPSHLTSFHPYQHIDWVISDPGKKMENISVNQVIEYTRHIFNE
jgi:ADP-heptose:LPS heptosyltransferase